MAASSVSEPGPSIEFSRGSVSLAIALAPAASRQCSDPLPRSSDGPPPGPTACPPPGPMDGPPPGPIDSPPPGPIDNPPPGPIDFPPPGPIESQPPGPIEPGMQSRQACAALLDAPTASMNKTRTSMRSEEHTSELQSR